MSDEQLLLTHHSSLITHHSIMSTPTITVAPDKTVQELLGSPRVRSAFQFFESRAAEITEDHIRLCSIPAPPFGEAVRAAYLSERFREHGLREAQIDEEGNCVALRVGRTPGPLLVVSAHLDTVFPA